LNSDPDVTQVPPSVQPLLRWCLEKERKDRLAAIGDARRLLAEGSATGVVTAAGVPLWRRPTTWAIGALAALLIAESGALVRGPTPGAQPAARLSIALPAGQELTSYPAITRDGRTIAYTARQGVAESLLYLRDLDSFDARVVAGSSGAKQPFFSPDGHWVAFFAQGQLSRAEVSGGTPIKVADAPIGYGAMWNADDTIVYAPTIGSGLMRVGASGGTPESLTRPDDAGKGYAHTFPEALPGGRSVLFQIWGQNNGVALFSLDSRTWQTIVPGTGFRTAIYDRSGSAGRLLIADLGAGVRSAPFDAAAP